MRIEVQLTDGAIPERIACPANGAAGAWLEFRGVVRAEEGTEAIRALDYEAYPEMAVRTMTQILEDLDRTFPCLHARVIHRIGTVPVGEAAIYVGIASEHRRNGFAVLEVFMDRLKQDVPIWKRRAVPRATPQ